MRAAIAAAIALAVVAPRDARANAAVFTEAGIRLDTPKGWTFKRRDGDTGLFMAAAPAKVAKDQAIALVMWFPGEDDKPFREIVEKQLKSDMGTIKWSDETRSSVAGMSGTMKRGSATIDGTAANVTMNVFHTPKQHVVFVIRFVSAQAERTRVDETDSIVRSIKPVK